MTSLPRNSERVATRRRIGAVDVSVCSELPSVVDAFEALYEGFDEPASASAETVNMEVQPVPRAWLARQRCLILGDGQPVAPEVRTDRALPYIEWGINQRLARRKDFLLVHAAALAWRGRGVIFPANSGSGKSTLSMTLLSRGWKYFSDEAAMIDPATLELHAFPKALCIKTGSFDLARRAGLSFSGGAYRVEGYKREVAYINPLQFGRDVVAAPTRVAAIVLPAYTPGFAPRLRRISQGHAAFAMTQHAMNRSTFGEAAIAAFAQIAREADCFALDIGSPDETCALLEQAGSGNF